MDSINVQILRAMEELEMLLRESGQFAGVRSWQKDMLDQRIDAKRVEIKELRVKLDPYLNDETDATHLEEGAPVYGEK